MNYLEILENINTRFVLLKLDKINYIVDKINNNSLIIISDPIINYNELVKEMKKRGVQILNKIDDIYSEYTEVPSNILFYKDGKFLNNRKEEVRTLSLIKRIIYNQNGKETGCIISAITNEFVTIKDKKRIENNIKNYAFHNLYPKTGLNVYSDTYEDTISLVIIKGINEISYQELEPIEKIIINW